MRLKTILSIMILGIGLMAYGQESAEELIIPAKEAQLKTALYAAPSDKKEGAMIYGYDERGNLTVIREGTNDLICLTDDPTKDGISSACYFNGLEPFMARGRELAREGKTFEEKKEIRGSEVKSGKLKIPENSMLFVYSANAEDYSIETGELSDGHLRYVVYTPYATTESTGLPDKPYSPGMPWLMFPGTYHAHIMITPVK